VSASVEEAIQANLALAAADLMILTGTRLRSRVGLAALPHLVLTFAVVGGRSPFALMTVAAWALFVHAPVVLVCVGIAARRWWVVALAAALVLVGTDAFLVEPRWLDVTHVRLPGPGVRIALVADLQTDDVGDYERGVIATIAAEQPDVVLFAGDYLQNLDPAGFVENAGRLRELLRQLHPRLGAIAVEGDVDTDTWPTIFAGLPITVVTKTRTIDLGPIVVTALDPVDARSGAPHVEKQGKFHVVVGHPPDFALARPPADLLLAGHTHGGQVRIPGFGPLVTLSRVPRGWAAGHTALPWGGDLYVSRGVGMERHPDAPRIRLFCRPELVILELGS
jgi:hypothetical protein